MTTGSAADAVVIREEWPPEPPAAPSPWKKLLLTYWTLTCSAGNLSAAIATALRVRAGSHERREHRLPSGQAPVQLAGTDEPW